MYEKKDNKKFYNLQVETPIGIEFHNGFCLDPCVDVYNEVCCIFLASIQDKLLPNAAGLCRNGQQSSSFNKKSDRNLRINFLKRRNKLNKQNQGTSSVHMRRTR